MKRIFSSGARRRFTVATVVVIATLGFAVGSASAGTRHFPIHNQRMCPLFFDYGCDPLPIHVPPTWTIPTHLTTTSTTTVAPPVTMPVPGTIKPPVSLPRPPTACPPGGPVRMGANSTSKSAAIMCPLAASGGTSSAGASTGYGSSSAVEIGTACTITRVNGITKSSGCAN